MSSAEASGLAEQEYERLRLEVAAAQVTCDEAQSRLEGLCKEVDALVATLCPSCSRTAHALLL